MVCLKMLDNYTETYATMWLTMKVNQFTEGGFTTTRDAVYYWSNV